MPRGRSVLVSWGEDGHYLAVDDGGRLVRFQCKTCHTRG